LLYIILNLTKVSIHISSPLKFMIKNRIRIVKLPKLVKSIRDYDVKKIPKETREKLKADRRGVIALNGKQMKELLSDSEITYKRNN